MRQLLKKKEIFKIKSVTLDPSSMTEPVTGADYQKRGMAYYARQQFSQAEADLKHAVALDGDAIDAFYSLGMVYKALQDKNDAIEAFTRAIDLIKARPEKGEARYAMLRRLALGHINQVSQGDWNLEKEIWKRTA